MAVLLLALARRTDALRPLLSLFTPAPMPPQHAATMLQANLRGGFPRPETRSELLNLLSDLRCNLAAFCETWGDAPEQLPGWQVFSWSRARRRGGGVAILVRADAPARRIDIDMHGLATDDLEFVAVSASLAGVAAPVSILCTYLPGGATLAARQALQHILTVVSARVGFLLVVGDYMNSMSTTVSRTTWHPSPPTVEPSSFCSRTPIWSASMTDPPLFCLVATRSRRPTSAWPMQ